MKPGIEAIEARLHSRFPDAAVAVIDDSHLHAGHAGSRDGAGHYTVRITAPAFAGVPRIGRHRLVYDAFSDWIPQRIHALVVRAHAPGEAGAD